jgi:hypothetical protein
MKKGVINSDEKAEAAGLYQRVRPSELTQYSRGPMRL